MDFVFSFFSGFFSYNCQKYAFARLLFFRYDDTERRNKMLNQIVLVGRLVKDPTLRELESGKKVTYITLAVPRSYKNMDGIYETDFIECILWEHIAQNTTDYCRKGDMLGVKGRMQSRKVEGTDKVNRTILEVVAEKVTFLSSKEKE